MNLFLFEYGIYCNCFSRVGVSEKGTATIELTVSGAPGHSSFPPAESPIGILSAAVSRLEKSPLPSMFGYGPEKQMFEYLAPHVGISENGPRRTCSFISAAR